MKTIGIILARKGSKGLKNKNRLKINGKSLVEITIDNAKKSKFLDEYSNIQNYFNQSHWIYFLLYPPNV